MNPQILVPYDGSDTANAALRYAVERFPNASIELFHVVEPFAEHTDAGAEDSQRRWFQKATNYANEVFEIAQTVLEDYDRSIKMEWRYGRPGHVIVDRVNEGDFDYVIMGSHGRSGIERMLLGSVAETTLRRSPVPVTIIPKQ